MTAIQIYDTTLRDGTQREGVSLSCADKLRIAQRLDELGVAYIEGGWPGSNPKDVEFFQRAGQLQLRQARIAAFGATCHAGSRPDADANLRALLDAHTPVCTVVGKSWLLHVTEVLQTTAAENLRMISESARIATRCFWFTTLVSKSASLPAIYDAMKLANVVQHKTIVMRQGQKQSRLVAWTFLNPQQQEGWRKLRW